MLTQINNEEQQNVKSNDFQFENDSEIKELEQLEIFADIIISILLKENLNNSDNGK